METKWWVVITIVEDMGLDFLKCIPSRATWHICHQGNVNKWNGWWGLVGCWLEKALQWWQDQSYWEKGLFAWVQIEGHEWKSCLQSALKLTKSTFYLKEIKWMRVYENKWRKEIYDLEATRELIYLNSKKWTVFEVGCRKAVWIGNERNIKR